MKKIALMYHDVYLESPEESGFISKGANLYKMKVSLFREHLKLIKDIAPGAILTFDDGGISFNSLIASCLEEHGLIGHFYIASNYIGTEGFLTEENIKDLYHRGHIIGAHSASHPENLDALSLDERKLEWSKSLDRLSEIISAPVEEVSIPNGYYCKEDIELLSRLGVKTIYTSSITDYKNLFNASIIGRIVLKCDSSTTLLESYLTEGMSYKKALIKQKLLSISKSILGDKYLSVKRFIRKVIS